MPMLEIIKATKSFGGVTAVREVDLEINSGEIKGLIGPNGAGKTTLFNMVTGMCRPSSGQVLFNGKDLAALKPHEITEKGMARTFQNIKVFGHMTLLENVMIGRHFRMRGGALSALVGSSYAKQQEQENRERCARLLDFVGLDADLDSSASSLSYGQQRRLEIARAMATEPELLLLDEPAAGMNPQETKDLINLILRIRDAGITIFLIEHDMRVVMGTADSVAVLDNGVKIAEGAPNEVQQDARVIKAYLGDDSEISDPVPGQRNGGCSASGPVLSLRRVETRYGSIRALRGISMDIASGEIVALIGANGAGKTTALKTISGLLPLSQGDISFEGQSIAHVPPDAIVKMGISHVPEGRKVFPQMSVMENLELGAFIRPGGRLGKQEIREDLDWVFSLFPRLEGRKKQLASTLSGGEQQMLAIGRALMSRPRLLLLDEPSMGLAPLVVKDIFSIVRDLNRNGTTILLVEQNANLALNTASRAYVMETGNVVCCGSSTDLLQNGKLREAYLGE